MNEDWIHLELGPGGLSKCYNLYIYIHSHYLFTTEIIAQGFPIGF